MAGRVARAALIYALAVFLVGFVLGVIRTQLLARSLGPTGAVLVELPIVLAAAWWLCGRILARIPVARGGPRIALGALALLLLLGAELGLGLVLGISPASWVASWAHPAGALGLLGQVLFALIPRLRP